MGTLNFELLCVDSRGNTVIKSEQNLLNRVIGNGTLWIKPKICKNNSITDDELGVKLTCKIVKSNPDTSNISIAIKVEGEDALESFRLKLITHLKDERFDYIYIISDDVSKCYCEEIYPHIYSLENLLRKYLTLFFATKLGPKWWEDVATEEVNKKINQRKNNETVFSKRSVNGKEEPLSDTKSFLIDFKDLGEIIYRVSAGNLKTEDIIRQIEALDEKNCDSLVAAVETLKKAVKANIKRFFPSFEEIDFQKKWEYLYSVRNKVAHNGLIVEEDKTKSIGYAQEIISFLQPKCDELVELTIDDEDDKDIIEQYQTTIVKQSSKYALITREELAWELYKMDDWTKKHNRHFIGLKYFVVNILGIKGFDIRASYEMIEQLEKEGYIEKYIYDKDESWTGVNPTAIKIIKPLSEIYNTNNTNE